MNNDQDLPLSIRFQSAFVWVDFFPVCYAIAILTLIAIISIQGFPQKIDAPIPLGIVFTLEFLILIPVAIAILRAFLLKSFATIHLEKINGDLVIRSHFGFKKETRYKLESIRKVDSIQYKSVLGSNHFSMNLFENYTVNVYSTIGNEPIIYCSNLYPAMEISKEISLFLGLKIENFHTTKDFDLVDNNDVDFLNKF